MAEKMNVGEICNRTTVFAYQSMSVAEAARLMLEQHVGSLAVVEEAGEEAGTGRIVAGMLTDRDVVLAVVARDFNPQTTRVADIMSASPVTCRAEDSIADVLGLMQRHGIRRIPVTDAQDLLLGIITLDDLLGIVSENLQSLSRVIQNERKREQQLRG